MGKPASVDCAQRRLRRVARADGNSRMKWILHVHMGIIGEKWILHVTVFTLAKLKSRKHLTTENGSETIAERNRAIGRLQAGESLRQVCINRF